MFKNRCCCQSVLASCIYQPTKHSCPGSSNMLHISNSSAEASIDQSFKRLMKNTRRILSGWKSLWSPIGRRASAAFSHKNWCRLSNSRCWHYPWCYTPPELYRGRKELHGCRDLPSWLVGLSENVGKNNTIQKPWTHWFITFITWVILGRKNMKKCVPIGHCKKWPFDGHPPLSDTPARNSDWTQLLQATSSAGHNYNHV